MGIVLTRTERDDTSIGIWKMEETIHELESKLMLNEEERLFYNSLNKGKRNLHWLSSRVLLRKLLNTDRFIQVEGDEHGKPHLLNFDYELSISHSYDYAATIISKKRIGIDIEKIKPVIKKIAPKFLNKKELADLDVDDIKKLYVYWCTKESIFKLNGKKGLLFVDHIFVHPFDYNGKGQIEACICRNGNSPDEHYSVHYEEFEDYMLTYVIDK